MDIPLDEVIYVEAIASSSTGAAADADSTPTFAVYEEATDSDIGVGGNMTKRTSLTGDYRANFTASAANGFELGKWYAVIGSATVGGIAAKGVLARFRIVAAENTAGYPLADAAKINNISTSNVTTVNAFIGATGASINGTTALTTVTWTNTRAGYLDNINNATLAGASFPTDPADESLIIAATDAIMTRIGIAGAGLTALGDTRLANLDATISSRSTLTQTQVTGGVYALNSASFAFNAALDFSTTMKTSLGTAVAASAVASVTAGVTLANGALTTASIADGAITDAKFTVPTLTAPATGILGFITQIWRRFFKRTTLTSSALKTYANDGTTVVTTQVVSDDGTTQDQGVAL